MDDEFKTRRFREIALPHLRAAYRLARWLTRNHDDAEEVVQEAYLSAFKSIGEFRGGDPKAWILAIVRNTCYTWLRHNRHEPFKDTFDDSLHSAGDGSSGAQHAWRDGNPESLLLLRADAERITQALEKLPPPFREILVLRELEELSYREIADLMRIPLGTVMSRLARARHLLSQHLTGKAP